MVKLDKKRTENEVEGLLDEGQCSMTVIKFSAGSTAMVTVEYGEADLDDDEFLSGKRIYSNSDMESESGEAKSAAGREKGCE